MENCYNIGQVTSSNKGAFDVYIGGIAGESPEEMENRVFANCYFSNSTTGVGHGYNGTVACTEEQLKKEATFKGFDFFTTWKMGDEAYPYPQLIYIDNPDHLLEIADKSQLKRMHNNPYGNYKLTADITFTEADFEKGGDFYNNGAGWIPVGTIDAPFMGTFDGAGHKIVGLKINVKEIRDVGLFGNVVWGTIQNLGMEKTDIKGSSVITVNHIFAGSIAGEINERTVIRNCYNTGNITVTEVTPGGSEAYAGGIVGYCYTESVVDKCYNTGSVLVDCTTETAKYESAAYAGGIAGVARSFYIDDAIRNCYNTGSVKAVANTGPKDGYSSEGNEAFAGGIVGSAGHNNNGSMLRHCYNIGQVTAESTSSSPEAKRIGGIAGNSESSMLLRSCYYLDSSVAVVTGEGMSRTAEQMKKQETYEGFDFEKTWTMDPASGYPVLGATKGQ